MDLKAVIEAGSESATSLIERAAHAAEDASIRATEAVAVAREKSEDAVVSAEQAATSLRRSSKKPLIISAAVLVAAGGGYLVWKRRQASAQAHLSGEGEWGTAPAAPAKVPEFTPGMADVQSPDVVDEEFAHDVDEAADELAAEVVEAIEVPAEHGHAHLADAPEPAEPFVPGVADEQSPDVVDDAFAAQVDGVADDIAGAVVDAIESPEGKHT
ncbi:MAG: hypothetical protein MUF10_19715 [Thermoanaerobaculaceae bacterium]|jgi:hypothetical protein|nr:hypothetical protein [Thermoanaerobaculaceae bacterium]